MRCVREFARACGVYILSVARVSGTCMRVSGCGVGRATSSQKHMLIQWWFDKFECVMHTVVLSTKIRIRSRPIIVGLFHTILEKSKSFRVDSNGIFVESYMNRWVVLHVRIFATLGAYNTIRGDTKLENCLLPFCVHSCCCAGGSIVPGLSLIHI